MPTAYCAVSDRTDRRNHMRVLYVLVGLTAGLAGFCLFLVQPMMGKQIVPWFGGSASTWRVCLLFFQAALLAGYFYAYLVSARLPLKFQAAVATDYTGCGGTGASDRTRRFLEVLGRERTGPTHPRHAHRIRKSAIRGFGNHFALIQPHRHAGDELLRRVDAIPR